MPRSEKFFRFTEIFQKTLKNEFRAVQKLKQCMILNFKLSDAKIGSAKVHTFWGFWIHSMLQDECLPPKIDFDRAENELRQICCMSRAREPWFGIVSDLASEANCARHLESRFRCADFHGWLCNQICYQTLQPVLRSELRSQRRDPRRNPAEHEPGNPKKESIQPIRT